MYTVKQFPSSMIVGIELRTNYTRAPQEVADHWHTFQTRNVYAQISNKARGDIVSLYTDYASDEYGSYTCIIGCFVTTTDNIPQDMVARTLPASNYAVFQAPGPVPEAVVNVWKTIWQTPLNRSYTGDFELYSKKWMVDPVKNPIEVYIALR